MSTTERRGSPRTSLDLPLNLTLGDETLSSRLRDISTSGIRFWTVRPLPLMSRVQLALELPAVGGNPLALSGVVVRSDLSEDESGNPDPDGGPYDTAIFFDDLTDKAHAQLVRFLENADG